MKRRGSSRILFGLIGLAFAIGILAGIMTLPKMTGNVTGTGLITGNSILDVVRGVFGEYGNSGVEGGIGGERVVFSPGEVSLIIMGSKMNICTNGTIGCQEGWSYYDGGDAPAGGYMSGTFNSIYQRSAVINLNTTLSPGNYFVFVRALNYQDYYDTRIAEGGVLAEALLNGSDWNGLWTDAIPITLGSSTDRLNISFSISELDDDKKVLITGVYVTDNPYEVVTSHNIAVELGETYPTERDNSPPIKENIIENSGFETGIGHGWHLDADSRHYAIQPLLNLSEHHSGNFSFLVHAANHDGLLSKVYHLKPNKKYTLSLWAKSWDANVVDTSLTIRVENTYNPPEGFPPRYVLSHSEIIPKNGAWQRINVTGYLLAYPSSDYVVRIQQPSGMGTFIDDVQLEEGELSNYEAKKDVEIGLVINESGNIFSEEEIKIGRLQIRNNGNAQENITARYEILDYLNRKIIEGNKSVLVPANTTLFDSLSLETGKLGHFRAVIWVDKEDGTQEEVTYSIVPEVSSGIDEASKMGDHMFDNYHQIEIAKKLGAHWTRTLSPANTFRWSRVEPVQGVFDWSYPDSQLPYYAENNVTVLGVLGDEQNPQWSKDLLASDEDAWVEAYVNYVNKTIKRYSDNVTYWEIHNEPHSCEEFKSNPERYAKIFNATVYAIKALEISEGIDVKIVAMGGATPSYIRNTLPILAENYSSWNWWEDVDVVSTHVYPGNERDAYKVREDIIESRGLPVWNTETGVYSNGYYTTSNSYWTSYGKNLYQQLDSAQYYNTIYDDTEGLMVNFLTSVGEGYSKYFYYFSRPYPGIGATPTPFEYDDSVRPFYIAYSIGNQILKNSSAEGQISLSDSDTIAYLFNRTERNSIAVIWDDSNGNKQIDVQLDIGKNQSLKVYDVMGNEIELSSPDRIEYGRMPVYVEGFNMSDLEFEQLIGNGVVSTRQDSAPPNLFIADAPRGSIRGDTLFVRWFAIDDLSFPTDGNPYAITYSHRLSGYESEWSDWSPESFFKETNVANGTYLFEVRAKDEAGNVANDSREITVGDLVYWVSPSGQAEWSKCKNVTPLDGNAACSKNTANQNAKAGDTVYLRGGTYVLVNGNDYGISPVNSGTGMNNRITFKAFPGESPVFTGSGCRDCGWGLVLDQNNSYIKVEGITFQNLGRWAMITNYANHNEITKCTFRSDTGEDVTSAFFMGEMCIGGNSYVCDVTHNWVHNNTFSRAHSPAVGPCIEGHDLVRIGLPPTLADATESIEQTFASSTSFSWTPKINGTIIVYTLTGNFTGPGYANVYLNDVLVFNSSKHINFSSGNPNFTGACDESCAMWSLNFTNCDWDLGDYSCNKHTDYTIRVEVNNAVLYLNRVDYRLFEEHNDGENNFNTLEDNYMEYAGHAVLDTYGRFLVVRNNVMHNDAWIPDYSNGTCTNETYHGLPPMPNGLYGHRVMATTEDFVRNGTYVLVEGNRLGYASANPGNGGDANYALAAPRNIVRFNGIYGSATSGLYFKWRTNGNKLQGGMGSTNNRVYSNTFYHNGYGYPYLMSNPPINPNCSVCPGAQAGISVFWQASENIIKNNIAYDDYSVTLWGSDIIATGSDAIIQNNWVTSNGNPLFINPDLSDPSSRNLPDLRLSAGSGAVDNATYLTFTNGSGSSSTNLKVNDSLYFQDGSWGSDLARGITFFPDWIAVGNVNNVAEIDVIDYSTNTITLKTPISWSDGAPVWLYKDSSGRRVLYGDAPDVGAHEFQENVCGNGNVDSGEACDDANLANGDGCSSNCAIEETIVECTNCGRGGGGGGGSGGIVQNGTNQTDIAQNGNSGRGLDENVTSGGEGGNEIPGKIGSTGELVFWGAIVVLVGGIVVVGYALIRKVRGVKR